MSLLAEALGYARLAEPVRFRAGWEQQASLRLRDGDTTVLAEYDQHARILGGEPEQMIDAAAAAYLALTLDGTDVLLMAADHALRRELSRRVRDDLIRLGIVQNGPAVTIADGATASPGDLIICTRNDHAIEAGEPGRTLANGDLLRIEAITRNGLLVRRALDADPPTGQRRWTDRHFLYAGYERCRAGLRGHRPRRPGPHRAHGPGGDQRHRGPPARLRRPDPRHRRQHGLRVHPVAQARRPGPRPAPGPRAGPLRPDQAERAGDPAPATPPAPAGTALGVLSAVLERDGQPHSATQTRNRALADADHLAILHAIWTAETTPAREQRYQDLLMQRPAARLPRQPGHQARWLWRTMRAAELAGLDPAQVLAAAIAERDLAGARDIPAVIDARLRHRLGAVVPLPPGPWSAQVPAIADPERRAYVAQIAAMMDARKDRIGEHAAEHALPWAINALGAVPEHPWTGWTGSAGPLPSAPGVSCPATTIPPTRSAPNRSRPPRMRGPPGTRPSPPSDLSTAPTCAACPTEGCCTCATPIRSRPPGRRHTSAMSSARSAPPPGMLAWPASAPPPRPMLPSSVATMTKPTGSESWPPATRPCMMPTGSARRYSPPSWLTAPTGSTPPAPSVTWPWLPTPKSVAAILTSTTRRSARPNPNPSPQAQRHELDPDRGGAARRDGAVDQAAGRRAPRLRRQACRPAEPDHPLRRPRLRRPRPGLPALGRASQGRYLAPPKPEIPPSPQILQRVDRPRRRLGSRRLTAAGPRAALVQSGSASARARVRRSVRPACRAVRSAGTG